MSPEQLSASKNSSVGAELCGPPTGEEPDFRWGKVRAISVSPASIVVTANAPAPVPRHQQPIPVFTAHRSLLLLFATL